MTITLELPPETEASLLAQAKARGLSLDAFVKTIIANQTAAAARLKPQESLPPQQEHLDRTIDELFGAVDVPPGVGQGAMRRENWYRRSPSIPTSWLAPSRPLTQFCAQLPGTQ